LIARQAKTRSRHERLERLEEKLFPDYQELIEKTLAEAICLRTSLTPVADKRVVELDPSGKI
jgi:hypothetical protein